MTNSGSVADPSGVRLSYLQ